ncbi:granzyme D-like [Micropterus salmoides]|uniref:granzyme D-like n=1 Tax=Micropterus salmoides TaxID=27706 RepID=UPI0018EB5F44|nr:granzyme D-like [Micropterus salmoides]
MFIHCKLVILILVLTLDGQVHTGEIYGGHEAVPHSRPYMVLLVRHMPDGTTRHCGGFLLNEDFVMTAAHCQNGSVYRKCIRQQAHVSTREILIDISTSYLCFFFFYPFLFLMLSSKAKFSKNVRPIVLAGQDDGSLPKSCIVSGWGSYDNEKLVVEVLMEVNVTLIDSEHYRKHNLYCSEG